MTPVVSLTTIPSRLCDPGENGIRSCIRSLLNQTYWDYEVHFNIPRSYAQTGEDYVVPEWLDRLGERIKIFRTDDLGAITKIVPTLKRISDPERIIIICDDDLVYDPRMVEAQVANQSKYENAAVGYDGLRLKVPVFDDPRDHYFTSHRRDGEVRVLQGYKTVSFKRRFFQQDFFDKFVGRSWSDDIVLSAYLASREIDRIVTFHDSDPHLDTLEDWQQRGGVETFPVLRHTAHEHLEGCNILRTSGADQDDSWLWSFLDR